MKKTRPIHRDRGQAMLEYLVVSAALAFALFVPINDSLTQGKSLTTVELVVQSFQVAYQRMSFSLSIPE